MKGYPGCHEDWVPAASFLPTLHCTLIHHGGKDWQITYQEDLGICRRFRLESTSNGLYTMYRFQAESCSFSSFYMWRSSEKEAKDCNGESCWSHRFKWKFPTFRSSGSGSCCFISFQNDQRLYHAQGQTSCKCIWDVLGQILKLDISVTVS